MAQIAATDLNPGDVIAVGFPGGAKLNVEIIRVYTTELGRLAYKGLNAGYPSYGHFDDFPWEKIADGAPVEVMCGLCKCEFPEADAEMIENAYGFGPMLVCPPCSESFR